MEIDRHVRRGRGSTPPSTSRSADGRWRCPRRRRAPGGPTTVASSTRLMQSHRKPPPLVRTCSARWPMANLGSVPMPSSPGPSGARRLWWSRRSSSSVVHRWPCPADVLALLGADQALLRRERGVGVLGAAGDADEGGHDQRRAAQPRECSGQGCRSQDGASGREGPRSLGMTAPRRSRHASSLRSAPAPSPAYPPPPAACPSATAPSGETAPRSRTCAGWSAECPRRPARRPAPASPCAPGRTSPACCAGRRRPPCGSPRRSARSRPWRTAPAGRRPRRRRCSRCRGRPACRCPAGRR